MMQQETQPVVEETKAEPTMEQSMQDLRKIAEMRHKQLSQLTSIHFKNLCNTMLNTNGVSYLDKLNARDELASVLEAVLDFGLGITNAQIRGKGKGAKDVNTFAAVLVQALDNRFILIADNMKKQQDAELNATVTNDETKETQNV